jgi:hypothetical protein
MALHVLGLASWSREPGSHIRVRLSCYEIQRGPCWGSWPSEASPTSGQADDFSSCAASVTRGDFRIMGLSETLMLLMSREFLLHRDGPSGRCRPSVPKAQLAVLRRRRLERARSTARRPGTLRPGPAAARARRPERRGATEAGP